MNPLPSALLLGLTAALCAAHDAIPDGVEFLRAYMPAQDRDCLLYTSTRMKAGKFQSTHP